MSVTFACTNARGVLTARKQWIMCVRTVAVNLFADRNRQPHPNPGLTMIEEAPRVASDEIRYQGKAVHDEQWILDFIEEQQSGVLGLINGAKPHLVTQLYVYDPDITAIYLHGAQNGVAYDIVKANQPAPASFTTSSMGRYIPAKRPVNFTVEYSSFVANGTISIVENEEAKRDVLEQFMEKYAPHLDAGEDYKSISHESIDRTAVYGLGVES